LIGPVTPYRGGIAHFTTQLAKRLMNAGHDIQVISFKKQYPLWLYPGESDKDYSPGREKVDAEFLLTPMNPFSWQKTVRIISDYIPDKVIISWWVTFWGPAFRFVSKRLAKKGFQVTYLVHNTLPHETNFVDQWIVKNTLKITDKFIVMAEGEKEKLLNIFPDCQNIKLVPHPIYQFFPKSNLTKAELRKKFGFKSTDVPVLLFFGFVRPYKGLSVLLESIHLLLSQGKEIFLLIAGEFWDDRAVYEQQIKQLGLKDHIKIYDRYIPDNEVAEFFKAADIFVAPYTGGTQSGSLKIALGFGLPAVVTENIADEMIKKLPKVCKIVPACDAMGLAEGILENLSKPLLDKMIIEEIHNISWQNLTFSILKE
jgi:D-inositol-3-phosphate glycosyltransferase